MKAGFIGLGTMGASMAANLQKAGQATRWWCTTSAARRPRAHQGRRELGRFAAAVAEASEVIFASLPGPAGVRGGRLGERRPARRHEAGTAYFDLTTNSPTWCARRTRRSPRRARTCSTRRSAAGRAAPRAGKLAIWCGGDEEVFEQVEAGARHDRRPGEVHRPDRRRLGRQAGAQLLRLHRRPRLAEVFSMGVKAGIEPLAIWEAVRQGAIGRARRVRLADRPVPAGQVRAAGLRAAAGAQGRVAGRRAGTRD